ncbi:hypothetical protein Taro_030772 [Colocasia esculenta]|uniref:Uncharacterized protein n=1 Tax=Colocasia esculenta TaxID=4460 RepID=A0A843VN91_COLES|nr:hypothetical protein [Colocasia esculenta]
MQTHARRRAWRAAWTRGFGRAGGRRRAVRARGERPGGAARGRARAGVLGRFSFAARERNRGREEEEERKKKRRKKKRGGGGLRAEERGRENCLRVRPRMILTLKRTGMTKSEVKSTMAS